MMEGLAFQADKALLDTVFDGVVVIALKTFRISLANKAAAEILGFDDPDELVGIDPLSYIPREDRDSVSTLLSGLASGNRLQQALEVKVLGKRGKEIWIMARGVKLASNGTSVLLASFRDITAQKLADMALREAERKQMELLDISNEIKLISQDRKVVFANRRLREATGLSGEALTGLSILDMVHPDDRQAVAERYGKIMNGEFIPTDKAFKGIRKDGKPGWGAMREVPFTWQGKPAVMILIRDVTEERAAEEAVRSDEERYRALLENANESILIIQDWKVAYVNRKFEEVIGVPRQSLAGLHILDLTHPDDRQAVSERYQKVMNGEKYSSGAPLRGMDKDGKVRWADAREIPFIWEGKPAMLSMMVDITERKETEEALRENEKKYRHLVETIHEGIWVIDKHANTTFVNPRMAEMLGYSEDEMIGKPLLSFMDEPGVALAKQNLDRRQRGVKERHDFEFLRKDGTRVYASMETSPILDSDGKYAGAIAGVQDVTERRKAEETLKASEQRYRLMADNITDVIWALDMNLNTIYVSPSVMHQRGYAVEEAMSQPLEQQMSPETLAQIKTAILEELVVEQTGNADPHRCRTAEGETYRKDGSKLWVEITASFLRDPEGKPAGLMGITRDITERKKAEQSLQASEEKYRLLTEKTADIIWTTDLSLRSTYVSPSIEKVLGFTPEERLTQDLKTQMTPASYARVQARLQEELSLEQGGQYDPERTVDIETEYYHKNGSTVWMENLVSAIRDQAGHIVGVHGVSRDVSYRRQAEEALKDSERRYRLMADNSSDVIWVSDANLKISYASPSVTTLLGYSVEEASGMHFDKLLTPGSLAFVTQKYAEALDREQGPARSSTARILQVEMVRKDGSTVNVEVATKPINDSDGRLVGFQGAVRDITERIKAQEALGESEGKFKALVENSAAVVFTVDDRGPVNYVSPTIEGALGYSPSEIIGKTTLDFVLQEDLPGLMDSMVRTLAGQIEPYEFRVRSKSGAVRHILTSSRPIHREGRVVGLIGVMVDVTERKAAEDALKDSAVKYRHLFENTQTAMEVISGETGLVVLANQATARIFGFASPDDLIGVDSMEYLLPEDRDRVVSQMAQALVEENWNESTELRVRTNDGRLLWINGMVTHTEYQGKPALLISLLDVTSRREAELKVAESEEKNRLLIDNAAEGIAVVQDGVLKFVNPRVTELAGYPAQELLFRSFTDLVHPDDRQMVADYYVKRLKGEEVSHTYHFRVIHKEGATRWAEINAVLFKWEGKPAILAMLNDITENKQAEDALRDSENRYRLIAQNSSDVIWTMDMNLRITYMSPSIEKLTGYSVEESLSMKMEDGLSPASLEAAGAVFARGMTELERSGGKPTSPVTVELEMTRKDGSTVWADVQVSFMQDSEGKVVGIMGVARDIDERRRARKALEESEERFRTLIEGARDAIAVIDLNGRVTYRSPSANRITGGVVDNLLTTSLLERVHPDDAAKATDLFSSLLKSPDGSVIDLELRYRREDESWGVIEGRGTNLVHDPKIGGIVVNYRDITERRQAEEAFRESESRYRLLAENVSDVIWSLNMKSRQSFFSPSVTRLLGYTVEEATSLRIKEVVAPTSYARAMMTFSKLSAQQGNGSNGRHSSTRIEVELMRKDGSFVWVDISVTLVRDAEGQPAEVFGVIRDVTQRKKAEEALRTSEEYFRTLIENAWDAIAIVNAEGTMLYESPSSARIMGYEPEEIVGKNLIDFVRPEDVAANMDMFRRFRTEPGSTVMIDAGFRHKDGHYIECEGTLQNLLHDPKVNGIIANYRDVTDRRRAEEAILASEERFRNLVEATSDWVWETDPSGNYTYASSKACEVLGYEVSEIVGRSIFDFMPSRESSRFARTFKSHAEKREPFTFLETSRQRKDGKVIVMETSGVPFFGGDGKLLGYRGIGRDITNRKNVERELEKSVKKLEKTMEATIQAISYTMETRDPYTTGHQKRVTQLACAIAKEMGLAAWQIDGIRVAGLLHDIGKIAVPTEILSKPGKLSDIEFSMIKAHPKVGFDILKNVEFEWPIARVVVQHHERLDGSGYPYGIRGKDILQEARVLAVADVVEAMSSHRPYRAALGIEKALAEVARGEGTLYDPEVARACAKVFNERGFKFES
jgi:PAS domain S-box-containing protein/putative nucleotidyltransferase with HDIG domain